MPLGFERLNERQQRPNPLINFIKPLENPDKAIAEEFLSRLAAQCYPVMKKHYISVMALEEYEPNPEFLGRNFNAGEVIQLVLKDKQGRWLSMKFVQMVMMHELAHCKQMNHSRYFWGVRNEYAKHMEDLWKAGYVGEGLWGRGRGLASGVLVNAAAPDQTQIPEHLCGGSYRRRGRKRKRGAAGASGEDKSKLSYAERQQQRIQRKFGKHGDGAALGDDELLRGALETMKGGKRAQGKPRVANSKRGRELRANAALARLDALQHQTKKERENTPDLEDDLDSETESEWEDDRDAVVISDDRGRDMVKVGGDGDDDEEGAGQEIVELRMLSRRPVKVSTVNGKEPVKGQEGYEDSETEDEGDVQVVQAPTRRPIRTQSSELEKDTPPPTLDIIHRVSRAQGDLEDHETKDEVAADSTIPTYASPAPFENTSDLSGDGVELPPEIDRSNAVSQPDDSAPLPQSSPEPVSKSTPNALPCSVCSLENPLGSTTCMACSNVLQPSLMPNHWRCRSETCTGSSYINPGDAGRCGICGSRKPDVSGFSAAAEGRNGRPMGLTGAELLRWD